MTAPDSDPPFRREERWLRKEVSRLRGRVLDVGCGTGEHARILRAAHGYEVHGLDIEPGFLELARQKVPESRFWAGDMAGFSLGATFDAVICLFSSIGYARGLRELRRSVRRLAAHLDPGGILVLEPWFSEEIMSKVASIARGELPGGLSERQLDVLRLLAGGRSNKEIAKAANQIMVAAQMVAMGELLIFARKAGAEPEKVVQAIQGGAAQCWTLDVKPERLFAGNRQPGFKAYMQAKDLGIVLDTARQYGIPLTAASLHTQLFNAMLEMGFGDQDNSGVIGVIEALAGTSLLDR